MRNFQVKNNTPVYILTQVHRDHLPLLAAIKIMERVCDDPELDVTSVTYSVDGFSVTSALRVARTEQELRDLIMNAARDFLPLCGDDDAPLRVQTVQDAVAQDDEIRALAALE